MKKLGIFIAIIVVGMVAVGLAKNTIIKSSVQAGVKSVTGLRLELGALDVGLFSTHVGIKDMVLHNPKGYEEPVMVDLPEAYIDYNLGDILKKNIHLEEVRLNLSELVVVKNKAGELNVNALKPVEKQRDEKETPSKTGKSKTELPPMQIDRLSLKIGKVVYKDYTKTPVAVSEYKINLDETYSDITDPNALVFLVLTKALMNTTLGALADIDLAGMSDQVSGMVGEAGKAAGDAVKGITESIDTTKIGDAVSNTTENVSETVSKTAEGLGDAAKSLTEKIKLPFGGQ